MSYPTGLAPRALLRLWEMGMMAALILLAGCGILATLFFLYIVIGGVGVALFG